MTPLSEKAKKEVGRLFFYYKGKVNLPAVHNILKAGYNTAYTELQAELTRLKKENEELSGRLLPCEAFSIYDLLSGLSDAADILLHKKDYDGHGWEHLEYCYRKAKELLNKQTAPATVTG